MFFLASVQHAIPGHIFHKNRRMAERPTNPATRPVALSVLDFRCRLSLVIFAAKAISLVLIKNVPGRMASSTAGRTAELSSRCCIRMSVEQIQLLKIRKRRLGVC